MNESVKWAAENIHEWPLKNKELPLVITIEDDGTFSLREMPRSYTTVYYRDWQAARDELIGKPGWESAPDWAQHLAQDSDGEWWWFEVEPENDHECFYSSEAEDRASTGYVIGDWRNTLERRPTAPSTKTKAAIEEANSMSDQQWRGPEDGLPPVGQWCEFKYREDPKFVGRMCKVLGFSPDSDEAWLHLDGNESSNIYDLSKFEFRPLRTEEDKAVEEWCDLISDSVDKFNLTIDCSAAIKATIIESYRAGYRKQEPTK